MVTNKGDEDEMMEPPPLLETLFGEDGTETVKPLKAIKDKLGVGDGPLAEVKRFIPPIGQGSHSLDRRSRHATWRRSS